MANHGSQGWQARPNLLKHVFPKEVHRILTKAYCARNKAPTVLYSCTHHSTPLQGVGPEG